MKIIGCDFHTRQQQIEMLDTETGEIVQLRLEHHNGEARRFYEQLRGPVRVGIEATGYTRWFEQMLAELGQELWVGDAARIRAAVVRKQKNDERDATHLRRLMSENRFPKIWMPTVAERDLRQLVLHRVKLVQMRTKVMNQLHAIAMGCAGKRSCGARPDGRSWKHWRSSRGPRGGGKNCWSCSTRWRSRLQS